MTPGRQRTDNFHHHVVQQRLPAIYLRQLLSLWLTNQKERRILWSRNTVLIVGILAMLLATLPDVNGTPLVWINRALTFALLFFLLDWIDFVRLARLAKHPGMALRSFHHITHGLAVVPLVTAFALDIPQTTAWMLGSLWLLKLPTATSGFALLLRVIKFEAKSLMSVTIMFLYVLLFSSVVMHVARWLPKSRFHDLKPAAIISALELSQSSA